MNQAGFPRRSALALIAVLCLAGPPGALADAADPDRGRMLSVEEAAEWRAVGRVNIGGIRSRGMCTGALIRPDIVLTAAHCVVNRSSGKAHDLDGIHFVTGWFHGKITGHSTAAALSVHPFYDPKDESLYRLTNDIALIRLRDPLTRAAAEPFSLAPVPKPGTPILVVSYHREQADAPTYQDGCTLDGVTGPILTLTCPVETGASGAPVLVETEEGVRVIATLVARAPNDRAFAIDARGAVANLLPSLENTRSPHAEAPAPAP